MSLEVADVWVVAGPPGAGKTTVANVLLSMLSPVPALLDKDTMYGGFVAATLSAAHRPSGEREGPWYDDNVKVHEYSGMTAVAREIRSKGCSVVLSAPFTKHVHDAEKWSWWVGELGGGEVRLVWIRSDADTLRHRLEHRKSERDTEKLAEFEEFIAGMHLEAKPAVGHVTIDNRLSAEPAIEVQLRAALDVHLNH